MLLFCVYGANGRSTGLQSRFSRAWLLVLLAGMATYTLAGYVIAPRAIKHWLENSNVNEPNCRISVQKVYVNPFTLFLSLNNVTLLEKENKLHVSAARIDTYLWSVDRFRSKLAGRDVEFRDIVVTNAPAGEAVFTVPVLSATGLTMNSPGRQVAIADARLEKPDLQIAFDGKSNLRLPMGLPIPGEDPRTACVSFNSIQVAGGQIRFTDRAPSPAVRLDATNLVGHIARMREPRGASIALELDGRLGDSASIAVTAQWPLLDRRAPTTLDLTMRQFEFSRLSPYFVQTAGRDITAGIGDVVLRYERHDSTVEFESRISTTGLRIGNRATTNDNTALPLDLALALITDKADQIDISIPVQRSDMMADAKVVRIFGDGMRDYIRDLAATPFDVLAGIVGHPEEKLSGLSFSPGNAGITPETNDKISLLARALEQRPLLAIRARPAYDPVVDRDAIAAQQVRLHIALATSAGPRDTANHAPPDFGDPKVREILDEFAGERLAQSQRLAIAHSRPDLDAGYYEMVYDALVANEPVSQTALRRLARFRAMSVINSLAANGVGKPRLGVADSVDTTTAVAESIPLHLEAIY